MTVLRSKHVAIMGPECICNITVLIYCCVLTKYNTLSKFVTAQLDGLCQTKIRSALKVLKCGAGEGWKESLGPIVWEMKKDYIQSRRRGISYIHWKEGRLRIGHILRRNCLLKHVIEGKIEGAGRRGRRRKQLLDTLKKREDTGN